MAISLCLVPAVAVVAVEPSTPEIDGVIGGDEWDGATVITTADGVSTVSVMADTDYLYVLFQVVDSTDARLGQTFGNDQTSININPTDGAPYGMPCDIIFQMGADPAAWGGTSSGETDGWQTDWEIEGEQQLLLPADLVTKTVYYDTGTRVSEWKLPLASIAGLSAGDTIKVGGTANIGDQKSYCYPIDLDPVWSDASTYVDILVPLPSGTVDMTAVYPTPVIGIWVSPASISFGDVKPGIDSGPQTVTVTNTGSVAEDFDASLRNISEPDVYTTGLKMDGDSVANWRELNVAEQTFREPVLILTVPDGTQPDTYTATLVFWAEAAQ